MRPTTRHHQATDAQEKLKKPLRKKQATEPKEKTNSHNAKLIDQHYSTLRQSICPCRPALGTNASKMHMPLVWVGDGCRNLPLRPQGGSRGPTPVAFPPPLPPAVLPSASRRLTDVMAIPRPWQKHRPRAGTASDKPKPPPCSRSRTIKLKPKRKSAQAKPSREAQATAHTIDAPRKIA